MQQKAKALFDFFFLLVERLHVFCPSCVKDQSISSDSLVCHYDKNTITMCITAKAFRDLKIQFRNFKFRYQFLRIRNVQQGPSRTSTHTEVTKKLAYIVFASMALFHLQFFPYDPTTTSHAMHCPSTSTSSSQLHQLITTPFLNSIGGGEMDDDDDNMIL